MARRRSNKLITDDLTEKRQAPIYGAEDFDLALHLFMRDCKVRNLSEHTLKYYRNELPAFRKMLDNQHNNTEPTKITTSILKENVILYMMDQLGLKDVSINSRLRAIRPFFNFLHSSKIIVG